MYAIQIIDNPQASPSSADFCIETNGSHEILLKSALIASALLCIWFMHALTNLLYYIMV